MFSTNTLVAPRLSVNLRSIPAIASKRICTLFTPQRALLIDLHNDFRIICYAPRQPNGPYYIDGNEERVCNAAVTDDNCSYERLMMAVSTPILSKEVSERKSSSDEDSGSSTTSETILSIYSKGSSEEESLCIIILQDE